MFLYLSVILVMGGLPFPQADTPGQTLPWADIPHGQTSPLVQCMLGYGQQAGGTHPTGMHSYYDYI